MRGSCSSLEKTDEAVLDRNRVREVDFTVGASGQTMLENEEGEPERMLLKTAALQSLVVAPPVMAGAVE